jgi:Ca2+-binding EF-hand superfamily protein
MRTQLALIGTLAIGMTVLAPAMSAADDRPKAGIGPIQSIDDVQETAKMLFKLADTNNDGQISQKEAVDAGNLMVGGFFFRADANGDGTLTREEARQARDNLFAQQPLLKLVLEKAKPKNPAQARVPQTPQSSGDKVTTVKNLAADPAGTIGGLFDSNHDQNIQATEVRQAVQSGVQALFSVADTNQDAQLTPFELNAAVAEVARSTVQTVFQAADTDRNGELSLAEYDKALSQPAHAVFRVIDADNNNQVSLAELERAEQILADQIARLRVAEPANSLSHPAQSGASVSASGNQVFPSTASPSAATAAPR